MSRPFCVLDASALLALIGNEPGASRVQAVLDNSWIHAVNLAEVAKKMIAKGVPPGDVESALSALKLRVIEDLPEAQAYEVGRLGVEARRLGLSLGDCVCLNFAQRRQLPVMTTEQRWSEVTGLDVQILPVRPAKTDAAS